MSAPESRSRRSSPLTAPGLALAAAALLAAGCGQAGSPGGEVGGDTAAVAAGGDTAPADVRAADTMETAPDGPAEADTADRGGPAPTDTAPTAAARADTAVSDTAGRRWPPGGYMVYVRRGENPDSVAAAYGVRPDTVLAGLPGFYARLTAEQASCLARDERVKELARQIEERRPMDEPRGIPVAPDTAGG